MARDKRLFFMEAMWMRCNPVIRRLRQLLADGALGTVQQIRADLGFVVDAPATAALSELGVDLNIALSLGYRTGAVASLSASMTARSPRTASIATDVGRFDIPAAFHQPTPPPGPATGRRRRSPRT